MKLHHAQGTRSVKVLWLLEELDLDYELERHELALGGGFHSQNIPGGKFPAFEDGHVVMNESGAILEYVLERYGKGALAPDRKSPAWPQFLKWLHYAEATAFPVFQNIAFHTFQLSVEKRAPIVVETETPWAHDILNHIDKSLAGRDYLLGDAFGAADIQMGFAVFMAQRLDLLKPHENVQAWLDRLARRPALQTALA